MRNKNDDIIEAAQSIQIIGERVNNELLRGSSVRQLIEGSSESMEIFEERLESVKIIEETTEIKKAATNVALIRDFSNSTQQSFAIQDKTVSMVFLFVQTHSQKGGCP